MTEHYKMPVTGQTTTDFEEYQMAWRSLAEPIEKMFGMTLAAFDPSLSFVDGQNYITLPVWFVKKLVE
jgi:hypothetical protein